MDALAFTWGVTGMDLEGRVVPWMVGSLAWPYAEDRDGGAFRNKDDLEVRILVELGGMQSDHVLAFPSADHDGMASGCDDR